MAVFNNGIPDCYYSGSGGDIWLEMKWLSKVPKRKSTALNINLSELQKKWLIGRHNEGRNVGVILGTSQGCLIMPGLDWQDEFTIENLTSSRKDVAQWIETKVI